MGDRISKHIFESLFVKCGELAAVISPTNIQIGDDTTRCGATEGSD